MYFFRTLYNKGLLLIYESIGYNLFLVSLIDGIEKTPAYTTQFGIFWDDTTNDTKTIPMFLFCFNLK